MGVSGGFPLLSQPQRKVYSLQTHSDGPGKQTSCTKTRSTLREEQQGPTHLDGEQPEPGGRGRLLPVVRRPFTRRPVILTVWCGRLRAGGSPGLHSCCNDGGGGGDGGAGGKLRRGRALRCNTYSRRRARVARCRSRSSLLAKRRDGRDRRISYCSQTKLLYRFVGKLVINRY